MASFYKVHETLDLSFGGPILFEFESDSFFLEFYNSIHVNLISIADAD